MVPAQQASFKHSCIAPNWAAAQHCSLTVQQLLGWQALLTCRGPSPFCWGVSSCSSLLPVRVRLCCSLSAWLGCASPALPGPPAAAGSFSRRASCKDHHVLLAEGR